MKTVEGTEIFYGINGEEDLHTRDFLLPFCCLPLLAAHSMRLLLRDVINKSSLDTCVKLL